MKDHLGSASVVTDGSGTIVGEDRFYPFGETRFTTGTIQTDKLFTGQREMAGLGIYHYGARFYSPKLGRFLSADTIVPGYANPQALNRYSYVLNMPISATDPTGHKCVGEAGECQTPSGTQINGTGSKANTAKFPAPIVKSSKAGKADGKKGSSGNSKSGSSGNVLNNLCQFIGIGTCVTVPEDIPVEVPVYNQQNATATPQPPTPTPQPGTPTAQATQRAKRGLNAQERHDLNEILDFDLEGYMAENPDVPREAAGWRNPKGRHDLKTEQTINMLAKDVVVMTSAARNPNIYDSEREEAAIGVREGQRKIAILTAWMNSEK